MALDIRHRSLVFSGVGQIPPATAVNYVPWAIIGFIFQYVVRRKHFSYWAKYNCEFSVCRAGVGSAVPAWARLAGCLWFFFAFVIDVLSAALDAGTAVGVILVFFWCVVSFVLSDLWLLRRDSLQYPLNGNIGRHSIQEWCVRFSPICVSAGLTVRRGAGGATRSIWIRLTGI